MMPQKYIPDLILGSYIPYEDPMPLAARPHQNHAQKKLPLPGSLLLRESPPEEQQRMPPRSRKQSQKKKVAAKPKARVKKVLTEAQKAKLAETKAKLELKALKATALLSPPKELPSSAWAVLVSEQMKEKSGQNFPGLANSIVDISTRYKNLDPSEREVRMIISI